MRLLQTAEQLQIDKVLEAVSLRNCARHLSRCMAQLNEAREFGTCGSDEPMDNDAALAVVASGESCLSETVAAITTLKAQVQTRKARLGQ